MGGGPGKWVQPSRWGAKRGDPWTRWTSTFMEGQDGVHKKRHEGLSLMHENVTGSQAEKGSCGQAHLITWVHLVTWVGCLQLEHVGIVREQEAKYEVLKILQCNLYFFLVCVCGLDFLYLPN